MAFKTDERYKISKCYDHELLHRKLGKIKYYLHIISKLS